MADDANNAQQEEQRKRAEDQRKRNEDQRRQQQQKADQRKAEGNEQQKAADQFADKRSPEDQQRDINEHNERMRQMNDDALDEVLEQEDPEKLGYRGYGGMDIIDTRQGQSVFAVPAFPVNDPNLLAKRQLAEESKGMPSPLEREEARAGRTHPTDATARAEVIARR